MLHARARRSAVPARSLCGDRSSFHRLRTVNRRGEPPRGETRTHHRPTGYHDAHAAPAAGHRAPHPSRGALRRGHRCHDRASAPSRHLAGPGPADGPLPRRPPLGHGPGAVRRRGVHRPRDGAGDVDRRQQHLDHQRPARPAAAPPGLGGTPRTAPPPPGRLGLLHPAGGFRPAGSSRWWSARRRAAHPGSGSRAAAGSR